MPIATLDRAGQGRRHSPSVPTLTLRRLRRHNCRSALAESRRIRHSAYVVSDEELAEVPDHERYAHLVTYGRIDELLREVTEEQVAEAWARYENRWVGTGD